MTLMTDHALKAYLPDGIHTYYGYDEKPTVATGKALAFCIGGGIRYIPLTTLKKHDHLLCLNIGGTTMHPIEDSLKFKIEVVRIDDITMKAACYSDTFEEAYVQSSYGQSAPDENWETMGRITPDTPFFYFTGGMYLLNQYIRVKYVSERGVVYTEWNRYDYPHTFLIEKYN